ncbi:MAG: protein phosphatase 2C domain-containing protein [Pseudomonadota bacterium]
MMTSWQRWSATDIGNRRAQNEDALVCRDYEGLWAVIDGMGGINAGNVASAALAHAIEHMELKSSLADAVDQIEDLVLAVHDQLYEFSQQDSPRRTLGCTLGLMRLTQTWGLLAWVGDVRIYRWREQGLTRLTQDHLGPEQELTRLIGDGELLPDFAIVRVQAGDRYLLCSDGLHNEISDARLAYWLAHEPEIAQRELVAEALAAGGRDNLSFVILDVDSDGEASAARTMP